MRISCTKQFCFVLVGVVFKVRFGWVHNILYTQSTVQGGACYESTTKLIVNPMPLKRVSVVNKPLFVFIRNFIYESDKFDKKVHYTFKKK